MGALYHTTPYLPFTTLWATLPLLPVVACLWEGGEIPQPTHCHQAIPPPIYACLHTNMPPKHAISPSPLISFRVILLIFNVVIQ